MTISYESAINSQPEIPNVKLSDSVKKAFIDSDKTIIIFDDDPTGTQTAHHVPVLTVWDDQSIAAEIEAETKMFFILTNSRSLTSAAADALNIEIGQNIIKVFRKFEKDFVIISRSDSTLRGHFPNEVEALVGAIDVSDFVIAVIPAFFEGGRYTIEDIQYVKENENLIPAAQTPFAEDKVFGYKNSNLKYWIEEKSNGKTTAVDVKSFSIKSLRVDSIEAIADELKIIANKSTIIVNASDYFDLEKFALAYFTSGRNIIFRTAASFVKAISGIPNQCLLQKYELIDVSNQNGGLIVVGSYVPKTSRQLEILLKNKNIESIELNIDLVLSGEINVLAIIKQIETLLKLGTNTVLYTCRKLRSGQTDQESLGIGNRVADFITETICKLNIAPKFMIAKGGITSSEIATKALKIKRALVMGQAIAGVPVWKSGPESKFPSMSYIIFPGNVGDDNALDLLYKSLI